MIPSSVVIAIVFLTYYCRFSALVQAKGGTVSAETGVKEPSTTNRHYQKE